MEIIMPAASCVYSELYSVINPISPLGKVFLDGVLISSMEINSSFHEERTVKIEIVTIPSLDRGTIILKKIFHPF